MSQIKLTADSGGGTTSLKAPSSTTSNADVVLKLPVADGSSGQVLKTDGSGQLSFTSNAGTTINNNADNRVITGSGTANTLNGESNVIIDSSGRLLLGTTTEGHTSGDDLTIATTGGATGITLRSDTDEGGRIFFSDGTSGADEYRGVVGYSHDTNHMYFSTDATERLRIDSSGRVMIGTTSTSGISSNGDDLIIGSIGDSTDRGITLATTTSGSIRWADAGDNAMGRIQYLNNSDVMTFHTSNATRLRLDSDGMKFGSDSAAANALDDYEEGTWTPVWDAPDQASTTFGLNHQYGYYTKIGNIVHVTCYLQGFANSNEGGGSNDNLVIAGLPFTVADLPGGGNTRHAASFAVGSRYRLLVDDLILNAYGASTEVRLFEHTSGNSMVRVKTNQITPRSGTNEVYFAGSYRVA